MICPVYSPHAGGGGQYFPLLAAQLTKIAFGKIFVLTEHHPNKPAIENQARITIFRILPMRDTKESKTKNYSYFSFLWTYIIFYVFVPWFVLFKNVSHVHFTRYYRRVFYLLLFLLKHVFFTKNIMDVRATIEQGKKWRHVFGINCILVNSLAVQSQVNNHAYNKKIVHLVPNPFIKPKKILRAKALSMIKKVSPNVKKPFLLFVGQLLKRKSVYEVLDGFNKISSTHKKYSLVLIGRNMEGIKILKKIKKQSKVFLTGALPRSKTLAFIQEAAVVLQPSKIEGIPRVSLEAFAFRKKILLPPCVPEFRRNIKFLPKSINSSEIAKTLDTIIKNKKKPFYNLNAHNPKISQNILKKIYGDL